MLRAKKEGVVAELVERLRSAETLIVADYRGLTHAELDGVRTKLLEHGAKLSVCKNTLTRRAAEEAGVESLVEFLTGPTAIAFVHDGDMVAVAKTLDDTAKSTRRLELKGAVLAGRPVGAEGVKSLASLPPVEVLRGQVLGAIVAPLTGLLGLVNAPLQGLVGLIDARIEQLEAQGQGAPAPAEEVAADEAPAAEETAAEEESPEPTSAAEEPTEQEAAQAVAEEAPGAEEAPAAEDDNEEARAEEQP
jgi:large subunit ribosomal protein L10